MAKNISTTSENEDRSSIVNRLKALVRAKTTEMADSILEVPLSYYRDQRQFERETTAVISTPLMLIPASRIASPHDYVVREISGISVLVTRGSDGVARAFLNYCRHRGAQVSSGCGSARNHTCPYHAWTYNSAGMLKGIPGQEGFNTLDREAYGLVELPTQERYGFVWGVLCADATIDLDSHLGPLGVELESWGFDKYEYLTGRHFTSEVNWKAAIEAFSESYHFKFVHGESIIGQTTVSNTSAFDSFGSHFRLSFACNWIMDAPEAESHDRPLDYSVFIYWVYPNLILAVSPVGVEIIDILPGAHPTQCEVSHSWMATVPAADEITKQGYLDLFEGVHKAVREEDFAMLPTCGNAVRHGQHTHMVIGRNEIGVQHLVKMFAEKFNFDLNGQII